ncbi:MAG TPA: heme ABC exporter ATP-binding protein CcmA [Caulobacterales bacterium]|nr:heme ABC exporter ATP-binding protein CcmA [Caulobacterales bacterium]
MGGDHHFQASLSVERLTLARGQRTLFSNLSFEAAPGAFVELRGPNGVGKTTLLRAIAGFLRPASGRVAFAHIEEPALALHFLAHRDGLKAPLDARAHVRFWAGLLGGRSDAADTALARVGLHAIADLPARVLSQGQARRLSLARLLVAERPLWLLDEPASGLDTGGRALLAALIDEHRARGGVVIAAVHDDLGPGPTRAIELTP